MQSASVSRSNITSDDVWVADSGASCHMTHNCSSMYDIRSPPPGRDVVVIGDGRKLRVKCVGSIDVMFHGCTDARNTLHDVSYVPGLGFNLYSLHAIQRNNVVFLDASGVHVIRAGITFTRGNKRSCVQGSRLSPRSIPNHARQADVYASDMLRQLRHPIPPSEVSRSSSHMSSFSGGRCASSGNNGGRRPKAVGHPPVQPPQTGHLPVTAIAPAAAPAPHPRELTTLPMFTDYHMYRLQRTLMAPTAPTASTQVVPPGVDDPSNLPGVADRGMWLFGGGYSF